ncbi:MULTISPECIES: hypothetical protein [Aliivibrio]|uniref:Membrane protein n=2 Tax=Aliivibrio TaxID=511678 RepID=B6ES27_ALISL|nr:MULTISPECIES: hypothetical protein [Aliivibrio]AZL86845.1 hypothetical protein EIJ81_21325 [Aliivibrio salmonicida]MBB1313823.1 hypothetical protein [Aliivibrio sp. SR45-2]OEF22380.1 hypothetical protein A1Q5_14965 [Aliivibrio logei 5S-186]CAQ81511.1 putative membrane protein [Aliivibrio salmonicida LFI1238]
MKFSLLQYKRQHLASWSLILVSIVLMVCFSQNLGLSSFCSLTPHPDATEQLQQQSTTQTADDGVSQCHNSEHLFNAHTVHLDFAIPMFIVALLIIASMLKHAGTAYVFTEPTTSYGVRRHLAFCTFQE